MKDNRSVIEKMQLRIYLDDDDYIYQKIYTYSI